MKKTSDTRQNKRIPEASALREFFQEQWEYLHQLLEARQISRLKQQEEKNNSPEPLNPLWKERIKEFAV